MKFETEVFGKCILAGEHSVLRGCPALVVPVKSRSLQLWYESGGEKLKLKAEDSLSEPTRMVLWGVLEKALQELGRKPEDLTGEIRVKNRVPFGAGLGASAALCVAVARLFEGLGYIQHAQLLDFGRGLENLFHGESSGVDVAVCQYGRPIRYVRGEGVVALIPQWAPKLYLSFSGQKGVTSECIDKVKRLREKNKTLGDELDAQMKSSVQHLQSALTYLEMAEGDRISEFVRGFDLARDCFERWGLTEGNLDHHMSVVGRLGALACKPTGSGAGGHVLSLWDHQPESTEDLQFIPVKF